MQVRGTFPALNSGQTGIKSVRRAQNQDSIAPPKKRRQLTAQPAPQTGNPFGALQGLVGRALKGGK